MWRPRMDTRLFTLPPSTVTEKWFRRWLNRSVCLPRTLQVYNSLMQALLGFLYVKSVVNSDSNMNWLPRDWFQVWLLPSCVEKWIVSSAVFTQINCCRHLKGKAELDILNKRRHTALMIAVSEGRTSVIELLVSKGMCDFRLLGYLPYSC